MRWAYTIVLRNTGTTGIAFEQVEASSRAAGTGDLWGGMGTAPFAHRLAPGDELRINQNDAWGCPQCAPSHLPRVFADGVVMYYTLIGKDDAGAKVRVPIGVRLSSSVGVRQ